MHIILDFRYMTILIPSAVVNAIGAKNDFGFLYSVDHTQVMITRDNPTVPVPVRRVGRKPRPRSNMESWNEKEKSFEKKMGAMVHALRRNLRLQPGFRGRFSVSGEMIGNNAALFVINDAVEMLENRDLTGYTVVSPSLFRCTSLDRPGKHI